MFVTSLILAFRAERKARIDRGDRDLESEPDRGRIRHDLGKCDSTPLWGENAPRARLQLPPRPATAASRCALIVVATPDGMDVGKVRRGWFTRAREGRRWGRGRRWEDMRTIRAENRAENRIHQLLGSFPPPNKSRKLPRNGPKAAIMLFHAHTFILRRTTRSRPRWTNV